MMDQLFSIHSPWPKTYKADLSIASVHIRMHFISQESQQIFTRPFRHLLIAEGMESTPDLQIYIRHDKPGQTPLEVWRQFDQNSTEERQRQLYNKDGQVLLYQHDSKVLAGYDRHTQKAYYYIPKLDMLPFYEKAAPMRMIFHHLAQSQGWSLVHSASIGLDNKGVLLIGAGGSGKTTTALSAAFSGFTYLGDDYVLLNPQDNTILSLYQSGKFRWDSSQILEELNNLAVNPRTDKKGFFFLDEIDANVSKSLPFCGIVIPKIGGLESTTFHRIPSAKALLFLSASTIFQMPGSGQATLKNISKAIQHVPAYEVTLGNHTKEINQQLRKLIKGL